MGAVTAELAKRQMEAEPLMVPGFGALPVVPPRYVAANDNVAGGPTYSEVPVAAQPAPIRLVILESPYAGNVEQNVEYARKCVRDSLRRGEAPIASHLLYTQPGILDDDVPEERAQGIDAGLAWRRVADASVVYTDFGISRGMQYGIEAAQRAGRPVEYRRLRDAGRV